MVCLLSLSLDLAKSVVQQVGAAASELGAGDRPSWAVAVAAVVTEALQQPDLGFSWKRGSGP